MSEKVINVQYVAGSLKVGDVPEYQVSSVINELLGCLASKTSSFVRRDWTASAETKNKIKYNNLHGRSRIIQQYLEHSSKIEEAYKDIDSLVPFGKDMILRNLNGFYFAALDLLSIEYVCEDVDVERIRENSIFIIDFIINRLRDFVFESSNRPTVKENVELGINVVVAHAFIECVIMENPERAA
ncbi:PhoU domain-containing protein [Pseudomonas chlororaphis]|uniref:hypothetical protein n=1 Tax=Pseudomonas chlororaphis TaxID=587753 RepID=UPI0039DFF083